jgi:hypothetical protein
MSRIDNSFEGNPEVLVPACMWSLAITAGLAGFCTVGYYVAPGLYNMATSSAGGPLNVALMGAIYTFVGVGMCTIGGAISAAAGGCTGLAAGAGARQTYRGLTFVSSAFRGAEAKASPATVEMVSVAVQPPSTTR